MLFCLALSMLKFKLDVEWMLLLHEAANVSFGAAGCEACMRLLPDCMKRRCCGGGGSR